MVYAHLHRESHDNSGVLLPHSEGLSCDDIVRLEGKTSHGKLSHNYDPACMFPISSAR